jgi:hypothetical protein
VPDPTLPLVAPAVLELDPESLGLGPLDPALPELDDAV